MNHVRIFTVTHANGNAQTMWLCPDDARTVKTTRLDEPPGFSGRCDLCVAREQAAPGYVTPTLVVAPTSKGARRPTASECPPPRLIPPWAKPGQASKQRTVSGEERA